MPTIHHAHTPVSYSLHHTCLTPPYSSRENNAAVDAKKHLFFYLVTSPRTEGKVKAVRLKTSAQMYKMLEKIKRKRTAKKKKADVSLALSHK